MADDNPERRRATDRWIAPFSSAWDFIDKRDIDKHAVSLAILYGTATVTRWAMGFAEHHPQDFGAIAAVTAPYMALQAAAIGWYFNARKG